MIRVSERGHGPCWVRFSVDEQEIAIGKGAGAMSKEIIQFDRAMFETKLDAMIKVKVGSIVNAMFDAEADEIANAGEIRTRRWQEGVPGRPLRARPDCQGGQTRIEGVQAQGYRLRVGGDRTLPLQGAERGGIPDLHPPGGSLRPPGG